MAGKTAQMKGSRLPMYFRKKPRGTTASGHKQGRRWHQKGVKK